MFSLFFVISSALAFPWTSNQGTDTWRGVTPLDRAAAASADLDGDGDVDLMFGTDDMHVGARSGKLKVYDFSAGRPRAWFTVEGLPTVNVGPSSGVADVDCDGAADLVIDATEVWWPQPAGAAVGGLFVFYGPLVPGVYDIDQADAWIVDTGSSAFATSAGVGMDLDGDTCGDVALGGDLGIQILPAGRWLGTVDVASLPDVRRLTLPAQAVGHPLADVVGTLSDVDGDGLDELLITDHNGPGAWILNGRPAASQPLATAAAWLDVPAELEDRRRIAATRDIDGDGFTDLAIAGSRTAAHRNDLLLISGATIDTAPGASNPVASLAVRTWPGAPLTTVAMVSDVNGDGLGELAVQAYATGTYNGTVLLVPGAPSLTTNGTAALAPPSRITAAAPVYELGSVLFDVGDLDGDGRGDPLATLVNVNGIQGGFVIF